jgi:hypothetical protein
MLPAMELPNGARRREQALAALTAFIAAVPPGSVVGIDAPFGLPDEVTHGRSWHELIGSFSSLYPDAAFFRRTCFDGRPT